MRERAREKKRICGEFEIFHNALPPFLSPLPNKMKSIYAQQPTNQSTDTAPPLQIHAPQWLFECHSGEEDRKGLG